MTEGRRTEVEYFAKWAAELRRVVTVDFDPYHGAPMSLVERAVTLAEQRKRAVRRGRGDVLFDDIWCVFDRDEHPYVAEAVALAERNGIGVALSNPCFELWFVLHARDLRRHTDRHAAQNLSADLGYTDGKGLRSGVWTLLREGWETAEARSLALDTMHAGNDSSPGSNPSTSVARVIRCLEQH